MQVLDILARLSIAERASIDECYLDITQEASKRLAACSGHPPLPINLEQVHVCGEVSLVQCSGHACMYLTHHPCWPPQIHLARSVLISAVDSPACI